VRQAICFLASALSPLWPFPTRGGLKLVQITGCRTSGRGRELDCVAYVSVVSLFVVCTNEPFQTKPKSHCSCDFRFIVKVFSRSALLAGGGSGGFIHWGSTRSRRLCSRYHLPGVKRGLMTTLLLPYYWGGRGGGVSGLFKRGATDNFLFFKKSVSGSRFYCKWRLQNVEMEYKNVDELKRRRHVFLNKVGCIAVRYAPTFHKNLLPAIKGHLPWWCRQLARLKHQCISTRQLFVIFILTTMSAYSLSRSEQQQNFLTGAVSIRTKTVLFDWFRKVGQVSWLINALLSRQCSSENTALAW